MLTYASPDDLAALSLAPDRARSLIVLASAAVRYATRRAVYDTTPDGLPTDPVLAQALKNATVQHVEVLVQAGIADVMLTGGVGAEPVVRAASNNGTSLTFDTATADSALAGLLRGELAPVARGTLMLAGLCDGAVSVVRW